MRRLAACLILLSTAWHARGQDVVDSMVYDKGMEWKVFSSNGPASHFAIQGGTLWVATEDNVRAVTMKRNTHKELSTLGTLSSAGVTAMLTDRQNNVWFGTQEGLAVLRGGKFTVFTEDNGLCNNAVNALLSTPDGKVWVGTQNGLGVFQSGKWTSYTKENGLRGNTVKALEEGPGGSVWIGTNFGISIYKRDGSWSSQSMDNEMSWNDTKALAYDEYKKLMWAAVGEQDVNCFDGKAWKVYMGVRDGITCIMVDTQSRVWFGSSSGLMKYNGEEWITDQQQLAVPAKLVTQMLRDGQGNLWFASENGVVSLKNPYPF